jgi:hypothetical protein
MGYRTIGIGGKRYLAHRLAWLYVHGEWPADQIDHVNMDRSDARMCNLREATAAQNKRNTGARSHNRSHLKGVEFNTRRKIKRWYAVIRSDGKRNFLGSFDCPAAAHFAYVIAADKFHGEFARMS